MSLLAQSRKEFTSTVQEYIEKKEYQKAIDLCNYFIDKDSEDAFPYHYRAVALYHLDKYKESLDSFTKLLELDPESGVTYANRGGTYAAVGYDKKALADFEVSFRMEPRDPVGLNNRSIVYMHMGRFDKALSDIRKSIHYSEETSSENYQNLAEIYWYKGKPDSTLYYAEKSLEINPQYMSSEYYKLKVYLERKQQSKAYESCKRIIEISNADIESGQKPMSSHYMRAIANDILGLYGDRIQAEQDYQKALELINKQINLLPDSYLLLYDRGDMYEKLGRKKEAEADFRKARAINPNYPEFKHKRRTSVR